MPDPRQQLLGGLLREVSRSFYLTLRVLPGRIRSQVGLAYLLARTTDTIADTDLVSPATRLAALASLRARILGRSETPLNFGELAGHQASPAEQTLLSRCEEALGLLTPLSPNDRQLVRQVLDTITSGQELDLQRFADASASRVLALQTETELDDYTYRVAGCVGEFWTRICRAHLFPGADLDMDRLLSDGIRFGKGLQLVNILRDLPSDLRQGRCYLPAKQLAAIGLAPADLANPASEPKLRPLYNAWLDRAGEHLRAGWRYTNDLPRRCVRLRLACAWPLLIGSETLSLLHEPPVLDPAQRRKVSRGKVRALIWRSLLYYPCPDAWRKLGPGGAKPERPKPAQAGIAPVDTQH